MRIKYKILISKSAKDLEEQINEFTKSHLVHGFQYQMNNTSGFDKIKYSVFLSYEDYDK